MELSIIIPIYNVEEYLEECLDSIYEIKGIKKEVILINDGSTDKSQDIINKYKEIYDDETVVIVQKNKGLSSTRNAGIDVARGRYISFIDSDDFIDSEKFTSFFKECKDNDLDVGAGDLLYYCNGKAFNDKGMQKRAFRLKEVPACNGLDYWEHCLETKTDNNRVEVVRNLYKRTFLNENNIRFMTGLLHEDTLFMHEIMVKAKKVKYMDYNFYFYRTREGSIMTTQSYKNSIHKLFIANELQNIKEKEKINLMSWDTVIFSLYFDAVRRYKIKNDQLYNKIKHGKKLTFRSKVKKSLLPIYHLSAKNVDINLEFN